MNILWRRLLVLPTRRKIFTHPTIIYTFSQAPQDLTPLDIACKKISELSDREVEQKDLEQVSLLIETT